MTRGRRRQIDTSHHFCPNPDCAYRGWVGWGNLRANGHPSGGPWRQLLCIVCRGYFLETLGTLFHGKRASVDLIVRVIACLAEGLGIRGTARGFEVDPNTVLQWLVEAAEQLQAFSQHVLHDVRVRQVQLDELFALLSAVKDGEVSEAEAVERLERSPQWVWAAMDPESKLLLAIDVGSRTLALTQRVVHHVAQVLAPDCAPLFLTDGFRESMTSRPFPTPSLHVTPSGAPIPPPETPVQHSHSRQRRATLCGRAPGRRSRALRAKMPFEFPIRRAYDRYAIDTRDQEGCVALCVIDARLCWTFLLLQSLMVVTCV